MPRKNRLYQCPYEKACKCSMDEPCLGCETWAEHYGEFKNSTHSAKQRLKAEILPILPNLIKAIRNNRRGEAQDLADTIKAILTAI